MDIETGLLLLSRLNPEEFKPSRLPRKASFWSGKEGKDEALRMREELDTLTGNDYPCIKTLFQLVWSLNTMREVKLASFFISCLYVYNFAPLEGFIYFFLPTKRQKSLD